MFLQFNPSTGKLAYTSTSKKVQVYRAGFAKNDCCCFLDPTIPEYDSGATYSLGDITKESGTPYGLYESLADSNNGNPLSDTSSWKKVSDTLPCGNTNWDSQPPYGGVGRTPLYYNVTFSGITPLACSNLTSAEINDSFVLEQDPVNNCIWRNTSDGIGEISINLNKSHPFSNYVRVLFTEENGGIVFESPEAGTLPAPRPGCTLAAENSNSGPNPGGCPDYTGSGGYVSWGPL